MSGSNKVGSSVQSCPNSKALVNEAPENKFKNITIQCKHRSCPPSSHLKTFELVPDNSLPVNDQIIIDWIGNDPKPAPFLTTSENKKISGPPYSINLDNDSIASVFPEFYKEKKGATMEFGANLLKDIFTYNLERKLTIYGLPSGSMNIVIYNPDKWKLSLEFPIWGRWGKSAGSKWEGEYGEGYSETRSRGSIKGSDNLNTEIKTSKGEYEHFTKREEVNTLQTGGKVEKENSTTYVAKSGRGTFTASPKQSQKISPDAIVKLEKNGSPLTVNALGIIFFTGEVMKWMQNISQLLKDIPKAGAYMEYEFSTLEGSISLEWGWEEFKPDHRAFYGVMLDFGITVFDLTLEMGVGVSGFSVKFQAFASLNGKLEVNAKWSRNTPSDDGSAKNELKDGPFEAGLKGSIIGAVGARCQAFYFVKIHAQVSTGIELNGKLTAFNNNEPFNAELTLNFTGMKGTVTTPVGVADAIGDERQSPNYKGSMGFQTSNSSSSTTKGNEKVFLEEREIGRCRWPHDFKKYEKTGKNMTDTDIKIAINNMLNGQYRNSGFFNDKRIVVKNFLTMEELADENAVKKFVKYGMLGKDPLKDTSSEKLVDTIFNKIIKVKYFDRSLESLELFLLKTRENLIPIMENRKGDVGYMEWSEFKSFINGNVFYKILQNHIDNAEEFLSLNSGETI